MFKVGDVVVCIKKGKWKNDSGREFAGTKYEDKCKIEGINNKGGLEIGGYLFQGRQMGFNPSRFRKVEPFKNKLTQHLAIQVLTEQLKPQIERIEIKETETV